MYLPRNVATDLVAHILREGRSTAADIERYASLFRSYFNQTLDAADRHEHVATLVREAVAANDNVSLAAALSIAAALEPVPVEKQS